MGFVIYPSIPACHFTPGQLDHIDFFGRTGFPLYSRTSNRGRTSDSTTARSPKGHVRPLRCGSCLGLRIQRFD
jgi:hypothetical protein